MCIRDRAVSSSVCQPRPMCRPGTMPEEKPPLKPRPSDMRLVAPWVWPRVWPVCQVWLAPVLPLVPHCREVVSVRVRVSEAWVPC